MTTRASLAIFLFIIAVGIGIFLFFERRGNSSTEASFEKSVSIRGTNESIPEGNVIVRMTKNGFEPAEIEIKKGDTVTWMNEDSDYRWPASNLHPTHEIYPEFDPRMPLAPGEHWSFTFEKAGAWECHDHLHPRWQFSVIVIE